MCGAAGREGYQEAEPQKKIPCSRPGCYECFAQTPRSPLKKFCSHVCRRALRRVREREARWRRRCERWGLSLGFDGRDAPESVELGVAY